MNLDCRALKFLSPTEQEKSLVSLAFDNQEALKGCEIKFDDLEFHERIGAGGYCEYFTIYMFVYIYVCMCVCMYQVR